MSGITDAAGVLDQEAAVAAAQRRLFDETGTRLFVVIVPTTGGMGIDGFVDAIDDRNSDRLSPHDALFVVATEDREHSLVTGGGLGAVVTQARLDMITMDAVVPRLRSGDWAGAAVAAADGLRWAMLEHIARPLPSASPVTETQDVRYVGRFPAEATLVAGGATVRTIHDPNRGRDRYFAIDLDLADRLRVVIDADAPGALALALVRGVATTTDTPLHWQMLDDPGALIGEAGTYVVRYRGQSATAASRVALTFVVDPGPPGATPPPSGVSVCGRAEMAGSIPADPPGIPVCPGADVGSLLSSAHPHDVFAIDLAWGEELRLTLRALDVTAEYAYPDSASDPGGPTWYPLRGPLLVAEDGTFMVRISRRPGVEVVAYSARFDVVPAGSAGVTVLDIELAPGCRITRDGVAIDALTVRTGDSLYLRVTNTASTAQGLTLGRADRLGQGPEDGVLIIDPISAGTQKREWPTGSLEWPTAMGCIDATSRVSSLVNVRVLPPLTMVPDVVGLPWAEARAKLLGAGLRITGPAFRTDPGPVGVVLSTSPQHGQEAEVGSRVGVVVSGVPAPAPAPTTTSAPTPTPFSGTTPAPVRTTASPRAPAPQAFECTDSRSIRDPHDRGWRLSGIYWAERTGYDRITIRLVPENGLDGAVARVSVETVPMTGLAALGLPEPAEGEVAVVVRFSTAVALSRGLKGSPDKTAVRSLTALTAEDGRVHLILGVLGDGCSSLQSPMWVDPSTQNTPFVDVTVDVQH